MRVLLQSCCHRRDVDVLSCMRARTTNASRCCDHYRCLNIDTILASNAAVRKPSSALIRALAEEVKRRNAEAGGGEHEESYHLAAILHESIHE